MPTNAKYWFHLDGRSNLIDEDGARRFLTARPELRQHPCMIDISQEASTWATPDSLEIGDYTYDESVCTKCHLHQYACTIKTKSRGPEHPDFLCIGQAPGRVEDAEGMAFNPKAPAAGLMHKLIKRAGIDRKVVGYSNLVRCCPWEGNIPKYLYEHTTDRAPDEDEIKACSPYIWDEIRRKRPKMLLLLGNVALKFFIGGRKRITAARGVVHELTVPADGDQEAFTIKAMPIFHPSFAKRKGDDSPEANQIQEDLEFAKRLVYDDPGDDVADLDYRQLKTFNELTEYVEGLITRAEAGELLDGVACDIENCIDGKHNTRAGEPSAKITAISISHQPHQAVVYLVEHWASDITTPLQFEAFGALMRRFHKIVPINGQNYLYDWFFFQVHCRATDCNMHVDTMLAHHFIHNGTIPNSLEYMAGQYCGVHGWKAEMGSALAGMQVGYQSMECLGHPEHDLSENKQTNFDLFIRYSASDADTTQRLAIMFKKQLIENQQWEGFKTLYLDTHEAVGDMRFNGCKLDEEHLEHLKILYPKRQGEYFTRMMSRPIPQRLAAHLEGQKKKFNPNSGDQVGVMFWSPEFMGFDPAKVEATQTKKSEKKPEEFPYGFSTAEKFRDACGDVAINWMTGAKNNGDDWCIQNSGYDGAHWEQCLDIIDEILFYRKLTKLYGTYVKGIEDGSVHWKREPLLGLSAGIRNETLTPYCIHPQTKLHGAVTGRLSVADPSFQNIPNARVKDPDLANLIRLVKMLFVSRWKDQGGLIMEFDLGQIELRVLAMLANEVEMKRQFNMDRDIHKFVASMLFGKLESEVTSSERRRAKTILFGIIYGKTAKTLARDGRMSLEEAKAFIKKIKHDIFPRIGEYEKEQVAYCRENGYVYTPFSRIRILKDIWLPRTRANMGKIAHIERCAFNSPIQGTASDMNLTALGRINKRIRVAGMKSVCVNVVHDSQIWDIYPGELLQLARIIHEEQEMRPGELWPSWCNVKVLGDFAFGTAWGSTVETTFDWETGHMEMIGRMDNFKLFANCFNRGGKLVIGDVEEYMDKEQGEQIKVQLAIAS